MQDACLQQEAGQLQLFSNASVRAHSFSQLLQQQGLLAAELLQLHPRAVQALNIRQEHSV